MRILKFFLLSVLAATPAAAQVNPHTQIRWPLNCGTGPGKIYNFMNNTCVDLNAIDPSQQILWPPTCVPGTVYNPSNNSCVATGTANNPAGSNFQMQFNNGGFFGADPRLIFNPSTGLFSGPAGNIPDKGAQVINLAAGFGAVSDAKVDKTCSMSPGSTNLHCDDGPFAAGDVGKLVSVEYASAVQVNLQSTIAAYVSATDVTLANAATANTPTGMIDPDGVSIMTGPGFNDLGPGSISQAVTSGITGTAGQTCTLTNFNNGLASATATVPIIIYNGIPTIANGTPYLVTAGGGGTGTAAPTTATLGNGTATCPTQTVTVAPTNTNTPFDTGFGYYSGQWNTTTTGSGTGATLSIRGTLMGGGVVADNYPHQIGLQGTGYKVNDHICPDIAGADGLGCFNINKVNKTSAIWGTNNHNALKSWVAACGGTTSCYIPNGQYVDFEPVSGGYTSDPITFPSNTSVNMDPKGAIYVLNMASTGDCSRAGFVAFVTANNASNIYFNGLHFEGEMQVGAGPVSCTGAFMGIGSNTNVQVMHSVFNHSPGQGIKSNFVNAGSGVVIAYNYCDQTQDSCFNVNSAGLTVAYNTMTNTQGLELGGNSGLRVSHNTIYTPFGGYPIGVGGATAGRPYFGGSVDNNDVYNPYKNCFSIADAFAKGVFNDNHCVGMQGRTAQNNGLVYQSSYVPAFNVQFKNNYFSSAIGAGNRAYAAMYISEPTMPYLNGQPGALLIGNTSDGEFTFPLFIAAGGAVKGTGNTWSGNSGNYNVFLSGAGTYSSVGDTLIQGSYSWSGSTLGQGYIAPGFYVDNRAGISGFELMGPAFQAQTNINQSFQANRLNWLTGGGTLQGYSITSLLTPVPTAPGLAVVGTAGSTTYTYFCTSVAGSGVETSAGAVSTINNGPDPANFNSTNYVQVTCPQTLGSQTMNVYRSVGGPTQGRIKTGLTNIQPIAADQALAASGSAPASNQTGTLSIAGPFYMNGQILLDGSFSYSGGSFINKQAASDTSSTADFHVIAGATAGQQGGGLFRAYPQTFSVVSLRKQVLVAPDTSVGATGIIISGNTTAASGGAGAISIRAGGYDTAAENILCSGTNCNVTHGTLQVGGAAVTTQSGGTQTAGQLACIKSVGPPLQIGTCTAVSGATCTTCN